MQEKKNQGREGSYMPPGVMRLGSLADITAGQNQLNSDDAVNPDNAFPNPTDS
jgi:hypothetical protein